MAQDKKATVLGVVSLFLVAIDRALKFFALKGVSWLTLFHNDRIAFSLPISWSIFLSIVVIFVLLCVLVTLVRSWRAGAFTRAMLWFSLFLGASSNLYDRLLYGSVIDYVQIGTGYINIADVMIAIPLIILVFWDFKRT